MATKNWSYELVPKTGHSACQAQVLKFFNSLRPSNAGPEKKK